MIQKDSPRTLKYVAPACVTVLGLLLPACSSNEGLSGSAARSPSTAPVVKASAEACDCPDCAADAKPTKDAVATADGTSQDRADGKAAAGAASAADTPSAAGTTAPARPATGPSTAPAANANWRSLFDGKTLDGWKPSDFAGQGEPAVEEGKLILPVGVALTGVTYTGGDLPKTNYEIALDAQRVDGADFFCGLTFPVGDSHASLILGGWGGSLCGISSLDDEDAAHNETRTTRPFKSGQWYHVRLRVLPERLIAWVDDAKIIDVNTRGKQISLRRDIDASKPLGLASFQTTAAIKDVKIRKLDAAGQ
jgi:hypothetical protein